MRRIDTRLLLLVVLLAVLGCGQTTDKNSGAAKAAADIMPSDPNLARAYEQSCKSCHASGLSGAPRSGDTKAWQPRLEKGMETLIEHTLNGFRGMPPLGACGDCSVDEFEALIRFMGGVADER